jgi:hypothetical protein
MYCCSCFVFIICATCNVLHFKYVLYFCIRTTRSTCKMHNKAFFVVRMILCFPGMLLRYCLNDFEMPLLLPVSLSTFTFYVRRISNVSFLYFRIFSVLFLITFLPPEIAVYIIIIII